MVMDSLYLPGAISLILQAVPHGSSGNQVNLLAWFPRRVKLSGNARLWKARKLWRRLKHSRKGAIGKLSLLGVLLRDSSPPLVWPAAAGACGCWNQNHNSNQRGAR